jgi:hypothetical protein
MYHQVLKLPGGNSINEDLDKILSLLQYLPASGNCREKIVIWKLEGRLQFYVNSSLYCLKRITAMPDKPQKNPRPQVTQAMLKKKLNLR